MATLKQAFLIGLGSLLLSGTPNIPSAYAQARLLIDPGHNCRTIGATGKAGIEHVLTLEISERIAEFFRKDGSFGVELSRYGCDYSNPIIEARKEHEAALEVIINSPINHEGITQDEMSRITEHMRRLSPEERKNLYIVPVYAKANGISAIISVHVNDAGVKENGNNNNQQENSDNGYMILVNYEASAYSKSRILALNIAHQLGLTNKPSKSISNEKAVKIDRNERSYLASKGIGFRRGLIVIGNRRYDPEIPAVLVETGSIQDERYKDPKRLDEIAEAVYHGIKKTFDENASANDTIRGNTAYKQIALTFDGDWIDNASDYILQQLKQNDAKATFFLTRRFIERHPDTVRMIVEEGHEVGNHTSSHPHLTTYASNFAQKTLDRVNEAFIRRELEATEKRFYEITNQRMPALWRAPYGEHNKQIREWAAMFGYKHIGWTIDTLDWVTGNEQGIRMQSNEEVLERILNHDEQKYGLNGAILLMHVGTSRDKEKFHEILPKVILELKKRGYQFAPVSEIIKPTNTDAYLD